jgi:hypothetical protein
MHQLRYIRRRSYYPSSIKVRVLGDYIMCNKNCNDDEEEVVTNAIIGYHLPEYDEETGLELYYDEEAGKWKSR